jgi:hypothetical protein
MAIRLHTSVQQGKESTRLESSTPLFPTQHSPKEITT